ncbi:MAG: DUF1822 family protein [Cyanobacteria bacterium J06636_16]
MTTRIQELRENSIPIPITSGTFQVARHFSQCHISPEKRSQVYFNTLAVCAVNSYLQMLGVATNLSESYSWNPVFQYCTNAADLALIGMKRLECRPVLPTDSDYTLPFETPDDRVGVVVVAINEAMRQATLLGFSAALSAGNISLTQLEPMDELLNRLEDLEHDLTAQTNQAVHLSEWLNGLFEDSWQAVQAALGRDPGTLALAFRNVDQQVPTTTIKRAKLLDLGLQLGNQQVALLIIISHTPQDQMEIRAQVHPVTEATYLPPDLKLSLLSQIGETLQEIPSRSADNIIQLPSFHCDRGEQFQIQVSLNGISLTENFVT